jgi:hypothetical protein
MVTQPSEIASTTQQQAPGAQSWRQSLIAKELQQLGIEGASAAVRALLAQSLAA